MLKQEETRNSSRRRYRSNEAPSRISRLGPLVAGLIVVIATAAIYGQVTRHEFLSWDDYQNITENPHFNPLTINSLKRFWTKPFWRLYIPVSYTFYAAEVYLATSDPGDPAGPRIDPAVFHAGSLMLHVLCGLLVFLILMRMTRTHWAACAGALLFNLHPLQTESVCWITEQRGMVSHVFALASIVLFLRFALARPDPTDQPAREPMPAARSWLVYALATLAFALALLAKPSAVIVPMMILTIIWLMRQPLKSSVPALVPWVFMAAGAMLISKIEQPDATMAFVPPLWARPIIAGDALAFYLTKLVLPTGLGPEYGRSPQFVLGRWWGYATWIVPALILGALIVRWIRTRREGSASDRAWWACAGLFIVGVLPVLGLVPFGFQDKSTVADRYVYLAMLGPALAVSAWLSRRRRPVHACAAAVVICLLAAGSYRQAGFWKENFTLFARGLETNPRSLMAHNNMGTTLLARGKAGQAIDHFRQVLDIDPRNIEALNNLAGTLIKQGRLDEAETHTRRALEVDPASAEALINLGMILSSKGRTDEAIACEYAALRLQPRSPRAHNNLGADLMLKGDIEEALAHFRLAVQHGPGFATARKNLGAALRDKGQLEEALKHLLAAVHLDPKLADAHAILGSIYARLGRHADATASMERAVRLASRMFREINDLAWVLVTRNDLASRYGLQATEFAEHACRVTTYRNPVCLDTLAAAHAQAGDFAAAIDVAQQALDQAVAMRNEALAAEIQERLGLYREQKVYHE